MERGQLGIESRASTVFVFEDLIAHLDHPTAERFALRFRRWDMAVDAWTFDIGVCNHIEMLTDRYDIPVEVITSHAAGFAEVLADRMADRGLHVQEVKSGPYEYFSPRYAVDPMITTVYDPDPRHRRGYGFKCREFFLGSV